MTEREERLRAAAAAARAAAGARRRSAQNGPAQRLDKMAGASPPKRSARGFASAADAASAALRVAANGRGVADPRLLTRWAEIVGTSLAALCRPLRIKHRGGAALGGVLVVAARRGAATEVEHQAAVILERVNGFFGYAAAVELRITQLADLAATDAAEAARVEADRAERAERLRRPRLSPEAQARLEAATADIADDALREALRRLGERVVARDEIIERSGQSTP